MTDAKYERYQDYVIKNGRLIGEFEDMYKDFADPWKQSTRERFASEKAVALNLLQGLKATFGSSRVVELGCGFGMFTASAAELGFEAIGLDVSETAVKKGKERYPGVDLRQADFADFDLLRELAPDVIILAEITWYVLDHLVAFKQFCRDELPDTMLVHLLMTYPPGEQKYGADFFTNLTEIKNFFEMHYLESGEVYVELGGQRTWFCGTWKPEKRDAWLAATA